MRRQLLPALGVLAIITVLTGLVYPLMVLGAGQAVFSDRADGSLLHRNGHVIGSSLLAQEFTRPRYFHPRPSAGNYDGAASGASNLGPSNPDLVKAVRERVAAYRVENHLSRTAAVPVDAVTTSASGLDPDISVANAWVQAARVARARGLDMTTIDQLIAAHTRGRQLGFLGESTVNVLDLNLALDRV